jgi:hypothetical protein
VQPYVLDTAGPIGSLQAWIRTPVQIIESFPVQKMTGQEQPSLPAWSSSAESSRGLHNLVTGLTGQSPALSPSGGSSLTSPPPSIIARATPSRAPPPAPLDIPAPSLLASTSRTDTSTTSPVSASTTDFAVTHSPRETPSARTSVSRQSIVRRDHGKISAEADRPRYEPTASKEIDDPSQPVDRSPRGDRTGNLMPIELTRLFAVTSMAPPSRQPSYDKSAAGASYSRSEFQVECPYKRRVIEVENR